MFGWLGVYYNAERKTSTKQLFDSGRFLICCVFWGESRVFLFFPILQISVWEVIYVDTLSTDETMDHFLKGMCLFIAYIPTNHRSILALSDCEGFWRGKQLLLKKRNHPPGSRTCPSEAQAAHPHRQRSSSPPAHKNIDLRRNKRITLKCRLRSSFSSKSSSSSPKGL